MNIRILRSDFNLELLAENKVPTHIVSKSAECCNPTSPFKTQSCRRHPRVVVDAIENLQRALKGEIGVPHPPRSPCRVRRNLPRFTSSNHTHVFHSFAQNDFSKYRSSRPILSIHHNPVDRKLTTDDIDASTKHTKRHASHRTKISQIVHQQHRPNYTLTFGDSNSA